MQKYSLFRSVFRTFYQHRSLYSTSELHQRFYEYRTYSVKPKRFNEFIQLTNEKIHLRTAHSKLLGYWVTEYGGLNEVTHIWQYDNHGHRTAIRAALATDQEWISTYISKVFPMFVKQENVILYPFPWYKVVEKPNLEQGVYEMRQHTVLPGKLDQFSHCFQKGVEDRNKHSQLIGIWFSEFGELNQVYHLWHYRTPDERFKIRQQAENEELWSKTIHDCKLLLSNMSSKLLVPTKFSPWK